MCREYDRLDMIKQKAAKCRMMCVDFEDFLEMMQREGYTITYVKDFKKAYWDKYQKQQESVSEEGFAHD